MSVLAGSIRSMQEQLRWHPILAAQEHQPGVWTMTDPAGREYGLIEIRRTTDGVRYRVSHGERVIGWAASLRVATERCHAAFLASLGPQGAANGGNVTGWSG